MKFRRRQREDLAINLTPLIDVVFLLLIFFMVSTSFTSETQLVVNLPDAEGSEVDTGAHPLMIIIATDGSFRVNGDAILASTPALEAALRQAAGARRDLPLTIAADGEAAHRFVVLALDVAQRLGFERLTIAAQQPASQRPSESHD